MKSRFIQKNEREKIVFEFLKNLIKKKQNNKSIKPKPYGLLIDGNKYQCISLMFYYPLLNQERQVMNNLDKLQLNFIIIGVISCILSENVITFKNLIFIFVVVNTLI